MIRSILVLFSLLFIFFEAKTQNKLLDSLITKEFLYQQVSALAHDSMQGRKSGTKENILAGIYIAKHFKAIGLIPMDTIDGFGKKVLYYNAFYGYNIVGALPGKDSIKKDSMVIFSAHYDHLGGSYNGANDNASGTAALMALARYYKILDNNDYTLLFIAFTGEEQQMVGSKVFVSEINAAQIKLNINLEMLGRSGGRRDRPYVYSFLSSGFRKILNKNLSAANPAAHKNYFTVNPYSNQNLEKRSDHYSFNEQKIPAFTIMLSSPEDIHYHDPSDETQTLDFEIMQTVVQSIALACTPFLK